MTTFTAEEHGWHFNNGFVNQVLGGVLKTHGLCGGMAYSSLDYYFNGMPIPTHRSGDFGPGLTCPPDGRLRSMIYNRLLDSYTDNFGKWSCVYPDLDAAVAAALGLVIGGGLFGVIIGAVGGLIAGELNQAFDCPGGGPAGMTRQELPHLITDFLAKGIPAPIGLIYDSDILNIGQSHQVVAYSHAVVGNQTQIYIYDNNFHDQECMLTVDTQNPGSILETLANSTTPLTSAGKNGYWQGLLVEDGYKSHMPSYGQDIGIASPQSPNLSHQQGGLELADSFSVQNYGEYQAHYQSLGVEIDPPEGSASFYRAAAAQSDNLLAPGQTLAVTINVSKFGGDGPGAYTLRAGFNSVPDNPPTEPSYWLRLFYPPMSETVEPGGTTPVPDVCNGMTPEEAIAVLKHVGLSGEVASEQKAAVDIPQVFEQNPVAGTVVPPSSVVRLSVWIPRGGPPP